MNGCREGVRPFSSRHDGSRMAPPTSLLPTRTRGTMTRPFLGITSKPKWSDMFNTWMPLGGAFTLYFSFRWAFVFIRGGVMLPTTRRAYAFVPFTLPFLGDFGGEAGEVVEEPMVPSRNLR